MPTAPSFGPTVASMPATDNQPTAPSHTETQPQVKPALTIQPDAEPTPRKVVHSSAKRQPSKAEPVTISLCRKRFEFFAILPPFGGGDQREPRILCVFAWPAIKGGARAISLCRKRFEFFATLLRFGGADNEPPILRVFACTLNTPSPAQFCRLPSRY